VQCSGSKGDADLYNTWLLGLNWRGKRGVERGRGGREGAGGRQGAGGRHNIT